MDNCPINISEHHEEIIKGLKISFASIGIVTSLLAIVSLVPKRDLLMFRIILYTMIANGFQMIFQLIEILPVHNFHNTAMLKNGTSWDLTCKSMGFLDQVTAWMGHLCMTWIIVYLMYLLITEGKLEKAGWSKEEIAGIAVCYLIPFVFNWIPFLDNYYGFSGSWCWIKMTVSDRDCSITDGLVYIIVLYYGPLFIFVLFNLVACVCLFFGFFFNPKYHAKEFLMVLLYPFIYGILFVIVAINRLYSISEINRGTQSAQWWMAHAVADPLRVILPSMLVFVSLTSSNLIASCRSSIATITEANVEDTNSRDDEKTKLVGHI